MRLKKWLWLAVLPFVCWGSPGSSATQVRTLLGDNVTYVLFGGSNVDSTEQASDWIPVGGAKRVIIRTWSTKAAFHASTDADSTFSDSLITFRLVFSDSTQGTDPVTAADSVLVDLNVAADSTGNGSMIQAKGHRYQRQLRAPSNGSGLITVVSPISAGVFSEASPAEVIPKKWMRVRVTPLRRMTVTGSQSTAGIRVNGLKGFTMWATVIK